LPAAASGESAAPAVFFAAAAGFLVCANPCDAHVEAMANTIAGIIKVLFIRCVIDYD
jgi:hypothetical protein